jgi:hypothetical protein
MKKVTLFAFLALFVISLHAQVGNPWDQKIYMAFSEDEVTFAKDTTFILSSAYTPSAVVDTSGLIHLYYMHKDNATSPESLLVSVSVNAKNFTNTYPVSVVGSTVTRKINPCAVSTLDYKIRLYYIDGDSAIHKDIHSAISVDGINFTEESSVNLIKPKLRGFTDSIGVSNPDVFYFKGVWTLYYKEDNNLMRAISFNGTDFTVDTNFLFNNIASTSTMGGCG